jgi:hypothetical protein
MRATNAERNRVYGEDRFDSFEDRFFFLHIDPIQRCWHALGMFGGLLFYGLAILAWNERSLGWAALGVFFFYGFGLMSHLLYDGGTGRSDQGRFRRSTPVVIEINLRSTFGTYSRKLEKFIEKYPFVTEAYDLEVSEAKGGWGRLQSKPRKTSMEILR